MKDSAEARFLRVYANLPLNLRKEIIVVVDKEPISWEVTYREVTNGTKLAQVLLKKLEELGVI